MSERRYAFFVMLLFLLTSCSQEMPSGLRLYLNFDENLSDSSTNNFNGRSQSTVIYEQGECRFSLKIGNNTTDAIYLNRNSVNQLRDFTFSFLAKINGFNRNNNLISCANKFQENELIIGYNSMEDKFMDGWHLIVNGNRFHFENSVLMDDFNWHHIIITRKGRVGRLIIDGQQVGNVIAVDSKPLDVAVDGFVIGQDQDCVSGCFQQGQSWHGNIDELKIFSTALEGESLENLTCLKRYKIFAGN